MRKIKTILSRLKLSTRYNKTFAGKISDLIAYLGYKIYPSGAIGISSDKLIRIKLKLLRIKEQVSSYTKIRSYFRRWHAPSRPPACLTERRNTCCQAAASIIRRSVKLHLTYTLDLLLKTQPTS